MAWQVTPLTNKGFTLHLSIETKVKIDDVLEPKDVRTYRYPIQVTVKTPDKIKLFFEGFDPIWAGVTGVVATLVAAGAWLLNLLKANARPVRKAKRRAEP